MRRPALMRTRKRTMGLGQQKGQADLPGPSLQHALDGAADGWLLGGGVTNHATQRSTAQCGAWTAPDGRPGDTTCSRTQRRVALLWRHVRASADGCHCGRQDQGYEGTHDKLLLSFVYLY
jgi:hypothetical protein